MYCYNFFYSRVARIYTSLGYSLIIKLIINSNIMLNLLYTTSIEIITAEVRKNKEALQGCISHDDQSR